MKVFFRHDMSVDSGGYSPSAKKPEQAIADWINHGLDVQLVDFEPATESDLWLAHSRLFVTKVLSGRKANGHGNCIPEVTQSCLLTVGSIIEASRAAFSERIVCSPTSGFHHAGYDYNGAFCTFNGLVVAARTVIAEGLAAKVAIIDCDAHYGDGTDNIIANRKLHNQISHWTFGEQFRRNEFRQSVLLSQIGRFIKTSTKNGVDLVIYQAGADPHVDDPLGGYMTTAEMRERDASVFSLCASHGLPVVWNFAGGYQRDDDGSIEAVLKLHRATAEEAIKALSNVSVAG